MPAPFGFQGADIKDATLRQYRQKLFVGQLVMACPVLPYTTILMKVALRWVLATTPELAALRWPLRMARVIVLPSWRCSFTQDLG